MSFICDLQLLRTKIEKTENALSTYLASGVYDPEEGKKLIEALGLARDEFIDRLSAAGPEITDFGNWFTPSNFKRFASRILDGYEKYS